MGFDFNIFILNIMQPSPQVNYVVRYSSVATSRNMLGMPICYLRVRLQVKAEKCFWVFQSQKDFRKDVQAWYLRLTCLTSKSVSQTWCFSQEKLVALLRKSVSSSPFFTNNRFVIGDSFRYDIRNFQISFNCVFLFFAPGLSKLCVSHT